MHGRMQEQMNTQNTNAGQKHEKSTTVQQDRSEDYIDFEEIK